MAMKYTEEQLNQFDKANTHTVVFGNAGAIGKY